MHNIANNDIITLTAGDSFIASLFINYTTEDGRIDQYILTNNDTVYLSILKPNQDFNHGLIRKIYTRKDLGLDGNVIIQLDASDTEDLPKGTYYYEIKFAAIRNNKEYVDTIVPRRKFFII